MNQVKITSENADAIADFMSQTTSNFESWLQMEGYMPGDVANLVRDWESIKAHLICILGEKKGTGFRVEIK
jgi:hypothetical protein